MRATIRRRPASASSTPRNGRQPKHDIDRTLAAVRRAEEQLDSKNDPPDAWWDAIGHFVDAMCEWSATAPLTDLRFVHLCQAAAAMIDGYLASIDAVDEQGDPITTPNRKLVMGMEAAMNAEPHAWPPLESLQMLDRQGVSQKQIAQMHGLDVWLVSEILSGKAEYPKGHVTPHVAEQRRNQKSSRDALRLASARWRARREIEAEEQAISAEDMLADGATVGEVAEHFDVDEDAVLDAAEQAGMEPLADDDAETESLVDTVIDLHGQGRGNAEIAEITGESVQRVASIVRIHERSQAATATKPQPARPKPSAKSKANQKKRRAAKAAKR